MCDSLCRSFSLPLTSHTYYTDRKRKKAFFPNLNQEEVGWNDVIPVTTTTKAGEFGVPLFASQLRYTGWGEEGWMEEQTFYYSLSTQEGEIEVREGC